MSANETLLSMGDLSANEIAIPQTSHCYQRPEKREERAKRGPVGRQLYNIKTNANANANLAGLVMICSQYMFTRWAGLGFFPTLDVGTWLGWGNDPKPPQGRKWETFPSPECIRRSRPDGGEARRNLQRIFLGITMLIGQRCPSANSSVSQH